MKIAERKTVLYFIRCALCAPHDVRRVDTEEIVTDAYVEAADSSTPLISAQHIGAEARIPARPASPLVRCTFLNHPLGRYFHGPANIVMQRWREVSIQQ